MSQGAYGFPRVTSGGGGGGAPTNAEYIVNTADAALTNELVLSAKVLLPPALLGARPAANTTANGALFFATDTGTLYYSDSVSWTALGIIASGALLIVNNLSDVANAVTSFNNISPANVRGDLVVRGAANNQRLPIGAAAKYLRSDGTDPSWQTVAAADISGLGALATASTTLDVQTFANAAASGNWTKPAGASASSRVFVTIYGSGSGGGSGRKGASASARYGGGGGAASSGVMAFFRAGDLGATESVTIGAGGAGGTAITADSTNGNVGSVGNNSSFGGHLIGVAPATVGAGGTNASGNGASSNNCLTGMGGGTTTVGGGGTSQIAVDPTAPAIPPTLFCSTGGGAGGGISAGNVIRNGGPAAAMNAAGYITSVAGGTGGIVAGAGPGAGNAGDAGWGGTGGGGGAGNRTGNGQTGAVGARGAGGGGGGATEDDGGGGRASGAGGAGGDGYGIVVTFL